MLAPGIEMGVSSGGTGNLTLVALPGRPSYANVFGGSGSRLVKYVAEDVNKLETGYGTLNLSTLVLTRTRVNTTWDGTTWDDISPAALSISVAGVVRCAPVGYDFMSGSCGIVRASVGTTAPDYTGVVPFNLDASGSTTLVVTASRVYHVPVLVSNPGELDQIYLRCTATASGTVKFAIYEVGSDGLPNYLVSALGTSATITTGANATTVTGPFLQAGWYYFSFVASAGITLKTYGMHHSGPLGLSSNNTTYFLFETSTVTYGSFSFPAQRTAALTGSGTSTSTPCWTYRTRN